MISESVDPHTVDNYRVLDLYVRYLLASQYVPGKRVVDVACGTGFGCCCLKEAGAASVVGVVFSAEAASYAQAHYSAAGIEYILAREQDFDRKLSGPFDVLVSFGCVEYLPDPEQLLRQCRNLGHAGTVYLFSVPNEASRDPSNPFHGQAFDQHSFQDLLDPFFSNKTLVPIHFSLTAVASVSPERTLADLDAQDATCARLGARTTEPNTWIAVCGNHASPLAVKGCAVHAPHMFHALKEWNLYLGKGKELLEAQAPNRFSAEHQKLFDGLTESRDWHEQNAARWQKTAEERHAWLEELNKAKSWLEEQYLSWMNQAQHYKARLEQLGETT
jgi:SAM-dependent methyltransferase